MLALEGCAHVSGWKLTFTGETGLTRNRGESSLGICGRGFEVASSDILLLHGFLSGELVCSGGGFRESAGEPAAGGGVGVDVNVAIAVVGTRQHWVSGSNMDGTPVQAMEQCYTEKDAFIAILSVSQASGGSAGVIISLM